MSASLPPAKPGGIAKGTSRLKKKKKKKLRFAWDGHIATSSGLGDEVEMCELRFLKRKW